MVVVNQEEFRSLPGTISIARAYCAGALDDLAGTLRYARQALDLLPAGDWFWRGAAAALLGIATWRSGDLEAAHRAVADGMASTGMASGISATTSFTFLLADIRLAQGRLRDAMRTCQQGLRLVAEQGDPLTQGTADLHVILSEVYLEQDDLEAAAQHLLRSKELGESPRCRKRGIAGMLPRRASRRRWATWSWRWTCSIRPNAWLPAAQRPSIVPSRP